MKLRGRTQICYYVSFSPEVCGVNEMSPRAGVRAQFSALRPPPPFPEVISGADVKKDVEIGQVLGVTAGIVNSRLHTES